MKLLVKIESFLLNGLIVILAMFSPLALYLKSKQVELILNQDIDYNIILMT